MALDLKQLESLAATLRRIAALGDEEHPPAATIVLRVLGPRGIRVVPGLLSKGVLARVHDQWTVFRTPAQTDDPNHEFAHELGHWIMWREGVPNWATLEREADYIGAAIVTPPAAFRRAFAAFGEDYKRLAETFGTTRSAQVLRGAEVLGTDRALVSAVVRVRAAKHIWPDDPMIVRGWATGETPPGVTRERLRGGYDHNRIVIKMG